MTNSTTATEAPPLAVSPTLKLSNDSRTSSPVHQCLILDLTMGYTFSTVLQYNPKFNVSLIPLGFMYSQLETAVCCNLFLYSYISIHTQCFLYSSTDFPPLTFTHMYYPTLPKSRYIGHIHILSIHTTFPVYLHRSTSRICWFFICSFVPW